MDTQDVMTVGDRSSGRGRFKRVHETSMQKPRSSGTAIRILAGLMSIYKDEVFRKEELLDQPI